MHSLECSLRVFVSPEFLSAILGVEEATEDCTGKISTSLVLKLLVSLSSTFVGIF